MESLCKVLAGFLVIGLMAVRPAPAATSVLLESDTNLATAGYFRLSWETSDASSHLVEATDPKFIDHRVVYSGPDTARLISGKPDGDYFYRLEAVDDEIDGRPRILSNVLMVTVAHHKLERALLFFAVGAAVFLATLGLVLLGNRTASMES